HEILWIAHRQRSEHDRIHKTEDRSICSYAQRQSADNDNRKAGAPAENPQCMAKIAADLIQQPAMTEPPNPLLGLFSATDFQNGEAPGFTGRNSVACFFGGTQIDKRLNIVIKLPLRSATEDQPSEHGFDAVEKSHAPSNTLVIASAIRSHRCRCS